MTLLDDPICGIDMDEMLTSSNKKADWDVAANWTSPTQRDTRRANFDRTFRCTVEGCDKSYSRAGHLYRHQLNHAPKKIYPCDVLGCYRVFVRQDLFIRHRQRHKRQRSKPRDGNSVVPAGSGATGPLISQPSLTPTIQSSSANSPSRQIAAAELQYHMEARSQANQHDDRPQSLSVSIDDNSAFGSQPIVSQHRSSLPIQTYNLAETGKAFHLPGHNQNPVPTPASPCGRGQGDDHITFLTDPIRLSVDQSSGPSGATSSTHTELNGSTTAAQSLYDLQPRFPVSANEHLNTSLTSPSSSESTPVAQNAITNALDSMPDTSDAGPAVVHPAFDSFDSPCYPAFGSETRSQSSFAKEDEFTAWLFNEPSVPSFSGPCLSWTSMIPSYLDPSQFDSQVAIGEAIDDTGGQGSGRRMSAAAALGPGSLSPAVLSEHKLQELLHLMAARFNEDAYSAVDSRKDLFLGGNLRSNDHILSLRMMRVYIESYWYHFHPQLPILHRPAFVADQVPNFLLLAIIAIGASTLDRLHGPDAVETVSDFANFIAWHLRWEVFMDAEFQAPTRLWVLQTLLLIEVHEKMYSTRFLHERAYTHRDTTLALMRRSGLLNSCASDASSVISSDKQPMASVSGSDIATYSALDKSWADWVKEEATRRVVFAAFMLESAHAVMFARPARMTANELELPLPCDDELWSAASAAEVIRVQSSLQASGVNSIMFLDGLKGSLEGRRMRTSAFAMTIIMAGLLSVLYHMNHRERQMSSIDNSKPLHGRDSRRSALLKASDNWRRYFDDVSEPNGMRTFGSKFPDWRPLMTDDYLFATCGVLHGLVYMESHIDMVQCQRFADAVQQAEQSIDGNEVVEEMAERWVADPGAREAAFHALEFLSECLLNRTSNEESIYSARHDSNLNRPWVIYMAVLAVWCYGFALDGPVRCPPSLTTAVEQRRDMVEFLRRVGSVQTADDLQWIQGRNRCLGLLMILRDGFLNTRWELLTEASKVLSNCIKILQG